MVNPFLDLLPSLPGNSLGLRSQARLEETLQPRYEPAAPSENPAVPYYTGLILLSVLTFGFLLFLLFKKQIKEVRFATFATVLIGVGLPILAIVELTTDLVLREENSPVPTASPRPTARPSPEAAEDPEDEGETADPADPADPELIDSMDPEAQSGTAVVEIPLDFPNPASGSDPQTTTPGINGDDAPEASNELTLLMTGAAPLARPSRSSSPRATPQSPAANRSPSVPARTTPLQPPRSPFAPLTQFSQDLPRSAPRNNPAQPSFSLSHLDFSQPIRFERLLRSQLRGLDVLALQKLLQDLDFYGGPLDGYLGQETERAIARFQAAYALLPDGIFGLSTCEILNAQTPELTLICQMVALED
ncbi:peptidoglycan-binding protein [Spirulina sp. CCNP1310]|uniref:peptidoglycan-binding domain-containing protein n=1 Tax=Spirulina sp. CCNP1310 TaxID=3110249 RepID=UPI002B21CC00|nr:peptidoglycan-binding protein [Spirulina sp. CCNP1310]MEA5419958.1 peptidoglycan-binding protein [Spirulina sp. CCNP1310]